MEQTKRQLLLGRYELGPLLGQGTFAKVYRAKHVKTNETYAIKVLNKAKILTGGPTMMEQIKREITVMRRVRHQNVVELKEVMATKTRIYLAMEYVDGGDLFGRLVRGGKMKEDVARRVFQQIVVAVDFCHSRGVFHRDLKLENLLLDKNGNIKVSDFGLSALADTHRPPSLLTTACGTPNYVAPEILTRRGYDGAKSDVWALGVILYVLLAGFLPFDDSNSVVLYQKIVNGQFKCPRHFSPQVRFLLSRILDLNPETRISMGEMMGNAWVMKGMERMRMTGEEERGEKDVEMEVCRAFECETMNAFHIISRAPGFDLSGLFESAGRGQKRPPQEELKASFTKKKSAREIVTKLEEISNAEGRFKVRRTDGTLKLQGYEHGRKGRIEIDAAIFRVGEDVHMVEMKKSRGDTWECHKFYDQEVKPKLKDIVWIDDSETFTN